MRNSVPKEASEEQQATVWFSHSQVTFSLWSSCLSPKKGKASFFLKPDTPSLHELTVLRFARELETVLSCRAPQAPAIADRWTPATYVEAVSTQKLSLSVVTIPS